MQRRQLFELKLLLAELDWREEAVALDQPGCVVGLAERQQGLTQFLDGRKGPHPQQVVLERADERSAQPLPSGARTKAGELSMPRKAISVWKW